MTNEKRLEALAELQAEGERMEKLDFGDYCYIEQKRFGVDNEIYRHKVIRSFRSNTWVDVPVQTPATETLHDYMEDVLACIVCGVDETRVLKYREKDCKTWSDIYD